MDSRSCERRIAFGVSDGSSVNLLIGLLTAARVCQEIEHIGINVQGQGNFKLFHYRLNGK